MILWKQKGGGVIATPQPAHAVLSGQFARALADRPEPYEAVCLAAAQHDCPWMPWEAAPEFDAETGLPRQFTALGGQEHVPMWEDGVRAALSNWGGWVGLLVLLHGSHIYGLNIAHLPPEDEGRQAMEGYIARARPWAARIMAELGVQEEAVAAQQRKVALADAVALGLCWGRDSFDCGEARLTRTGPFSATLDPWPLAPDGIALVTEARRLPDRFPDADAMRAGLAAAPRLRLAFRLTPAA